MAGMLRASAAVLAGGESRRMGKDKAWIDFHGRPLVEHVVERLEGFSDDVFVVAKDPAPFEEAGLRVVADERDEQTPLAGIAAALGAARNRWVLVVGCDMPFVSAAVGRMLLRRAEEVDVVVPVRRSRLEPLHAVWGTSAADAIEEALEAGEHAVVDVLDRLEVAEVEEAMWQAWDPDGLAMRSVNTPEELDEALAAEPPEG